VHACPRDCSTHVFRARRQSASACTHRQYRMNADKEPCDKTTGKNCPKSALYLVAIACASTFFLHGERTCAGAPCLVSITLARSHVGAITLNSGLLHFCAILMMRKAVFSDGIEQNTMFVRIASQSRFREPPRFDRIPAQSPSNTFSKKHNTRSNQKTKAYRLNAFVYEAESFVVKPRCRLRGLSRLRKTLLLRSLRVILPDRTY
jgi:hypothetical protein